MERQPQQRTTPPSRECRGREGRERGTPAVLGCDLSCTPLRHTIVCVLYWSVRLSTDSMASVQHCVALVTGHYSSKWLSHGHTHIPALCQLRRNARETERAELRSDAESLM